MGVTEHPGCVGVLEGSESFWKAFVRIKTTGEPDEFKLFV